MENKPLSSQMRQTFTSQSSQCIKFRKIPPNEKQFNVLQCKYDLYRKGSPNTYEDQWNALRANNVRSAISVLELPEVENVIEEISRQGSLKENTLNRRDFADFPNLPNNSHRFKQMLSDQRQVKDFIAWFESQYKEVESSNRSAMRKFQDKQTLIASGFNQVLCQISKLSKSRSNILKILWNKENDEVKTIVEELNWHRMQMEKGYLENINSIHSEYQQAIDALKQERKEMIDEREKEKTISSGCINSVRCARKKIIRLESMVKDLTEVNTNLRKENLDLLDENTRFLMNGMDITAEEAILLITRRSKIQQEIARVKTFTKKHFLAALQKQSKNEALPPLQDVEDHKHNLYEYLHAKSKEWPRQKISALDEHFAHEDDSQIQMNAYFKEMMSRASFKNLLLNEHMSKVASHEVGIGTE